MGPARGYNARINLKEFEELIINNHDKTAKELSIILGNRLQRTRINYYRKLLGYTYKKSHLHPKRDIGLRNEFIEKIQQISKETLVFIDESGIEDNACREYGWSVEGTRCYGNKVYQHKSRISMIAGLRNNQIIESVIFEGNCNKEIFTTYVETILTKELHPGQTVIMDNINCGIERCQARTGRAQRNHICLAVFAWLDMNKRRINKKITLYQQNWEVIKTSIQNNIRWLLADTQFC